MEDNEPFIVDDSPHRFCISAEYPTQSLSSFVHDLKVSMVNGKVPMAAIKKILPILRKVGEGIDHLHRNGVIHGAVSIASIGRFDHKWKITNLAGSRRLKSTFSPHRMGLAAPPGKKLFWGDFQRNEANSYCFYFFRSHRESCEYGRCTVYFQK